MAGSDASRGVEVRRSRFSTLDGAVEAVRAADLLGFAFTLERGVREGAAPPPPAAGGAGPERHIEYVVRIFNEGERRQQD